MIRRINLLPEEMRVVNKNYFYLLSCLILIMYIVTLSILYQGKKSSISLLEAKREALSIEAANLAAQNRGHRDVTEKINAIEAEKKELESKSAILKTISEGSVPWSDLLYNLSGRVPSGLWLTSFSSSNDSPEGKLKRLKINGMSLSSSRITDFMASLNASPYFAEATLAYARKAEYEGREVFAFEISCRMRER